MTPRSKERLVGSLVLFCLAIIFIPPFYDGRNPFDLKEDIPTRVFPKTPAFPESEKMANSLANVGSGRMHKIEKKVKESLPESARSDSQLDKPVKETLNNFNATEMTSQLLADIAKRAEITSRFSDEKTVKQAWAVQVGSFKAVQGAQSVRDELIDKKYQAYIKTVQKNGETISRVFAGVSLDKNVAEGIKSKLGKDFNDLSSIVVPYQP